MSRPKAKSRDKTAVDEQHLVEYMITTKGTSTSKSARTIVDFCRTRSSAHLRSASRSRSTHIVAQDPLACLHEAKLKRIKGPYQLWISRVANKKHTFHKVDQEEQDELLTGSVKSPNGQTQYYYLAGRRIHTVMVDKFDRIVNTPKVPELAYNGGHWAFT